MADLRLHRRINQLDGDQEALEHIARALEGRVLPGPGSSPDDESDIEPLHLTSQGLKVLLEAMPAAVGILVGNGLVHANTAFAYAFGYRSAAELIDAGGLDVLLTDSAALAQVNGAERSAPIDALTRSRRKLKVAFAVVPLDAEHDLKLLRLIDQASLDDEMALTPSQPAATEAAAPEAAAESAGTDAPGRLEFLAKVSHEVRTPLNSIIGFTELMLQERFGPIGNKRYTGYVEDIHQSGLYALSLLNDLLDISKI
jgi:signal transduction histidine kinase